MTKLQTLLAVSACIASAFVGAAFERGKLAFQVSSPDRHTVVIHNMEAESTEGPMCALMLEGGETIQMVGKILRHGYSSFNPKSTDRISNRGLLAKELGDIDWIVKLMADEGDFAEGARLQRKHLKGLIAAPYLHHQNLDALTCPTESHDPDTALRALAVKQNEALARARDRILVCSCEDCQEIQEAVDAVLAEARRAGIGE